MLSFVITMFRAAPIPFNVNHFWITLVFIFLLITMAFQNLFFNKQFMASYFLFFKNKFTTTYFLRTKIKIFTPFQLLFFSIQSITGGLLLFLINKKYAFYTSSLPDFALFLLFILSIITFCCVKYALLFFVSFLFNKQKENKKLVYEKIAYFNTVALWGSFLLVLFYYGNLPILYLAYFICILVLSSYYLIIKNNKKFILNNLFYFILYLCTLELAPLILIGKLTF